MWQYRVVFFNFMLQSVLNTYVIIVCGYEEIMKKTFYFNLIIFIISS